MSHTAGLQILLAVAALLVSARVLAELARALNQPSVLGEILAGVLLGPTLLGKIAPGVNAFLFPATGAPALALSGLTQVGVVLFLFVAGMEVDLLRIRRQGRTALRVGLGGMVVPFALGLCVAWAAPRYVGASATVGHGLFALLFATALSITALPVIARTLMDLHLYRTDFGMVLISAAVLNDLVGWLIFAFVLALAGAGAGIGVHVTVGLTLGFVAFLLMAVRPIVHRVLPWMQARLAWPGGVLTLALCLALASAACASAIGIHAVFGAFVAGVALGDSQHMRGRARVTLQEFVSSVFAPLFFASIGLRVDFVRNFDVGLGVVVLGLACIGKIAGASSGALLAGIPRAEALAYGFGMNARGSMEIILGVTALEHRLIDERLFVALVVMAMSTSLLSGPAISRLLDRKKPRRFKHYLVGKAFVRDLVQVDRARALRRLTDSLSAASSVDRDVLYEAVWAREQLAATGLSNGVAVPHARLPSLPAPLVAIGLSPTGIDFEASDGAPSHVVMLVVTPDTDPGVQLELLADIARTFQSPELARRLLDAHSHTELLAVLRVE